MAAWPAGEVEMPIYVFRCPVCKHEREIISSREPTYAPRCLQERCDGYFTERVPTAGAVHFKGSGWTPKGPGRRE